MNFEFFDIAPRIFQVGEKIALTLSGRFFQRKFSELSKQGELTARYIINSGILENGKVPEYACFNDLKIQIDPANPDLLHVELPAFDEEQEISIRIGIMRNNAFQEIMQFGIYILEKDLYERRPLRGDFHCHTSASECGNRNNDAKFSAAYARRRGLDFLTLTDHMQMSPSREAQAFIAGFDTDFRVIQGEEVHFMAYCPKSLFCSNSFFRTAVHIVNFGSTQSVANYMSDHFEKYQKAVAEAAAKLDPEFTEEQRLFMAFSDWAFDKIHEFGGMAVFCHPFWRPWERYNLPSAVREYMLQQKKYDCIEVIGMASLRDQQYVDSNDLGLAWYEEACMEQGRRIPLVGTTDSHNAEELSGFQSTIVFAKGNSKEEIEEAVKNNYTTAVISYPGSRRHCYGSRRIMEYTQFLLREYFPQHDELCRIEGDMLMQYLRNNLDKSVFSAFTQKSSKNIFERFRGK